MISIDPLTGFLSKETMPAMLEKLQAQSDRDNTPFTVLLLDMDHFKAYNEKYGHLEGDDMLKYFAGTLRAIIPPQEMLVFRFGGDEFIIVFPDKKADHVYKIACDMLTIFSKRPFLMKGSLLKLHFSAGIATYPDDGLEVKEIIRKADSAMYYSKAHGRARVTIWRYIIRKTISRILFITACVLLMLAAALLLNQNSYTDRAKILVRKIAGRITNAMIIPQIKMPLKAPVPFNKPSINIAASDIISTDPVLVYLKTGRAVKGVIISQSDDAIELRLNLDSGKGSIIIKRSNIDSIDRNLKKY